MEKRQPKEGDFTPWGVCDGVEHLADGIVFVSTPSHGGFWLNNERIGQLPEGYQPFTGELRWAEEDCDALMLACFFDLPDAEPERCQRMADYFKDKEYGQRTVQSWEALKAAKAAKQ